MPPADTALGEPLQIGAPAAQVSEETIMALCGCKTREMLDHYDVETNEDREDGVGKLAAQFPGNAPVLPSVSKKSAG